MNSKDRPLGFLNVDLDIYGSSALEFVAEEMGKAVIVLYSGPGESRTYFLRIESARSTNTPEATINDLCRTVERLSPKARKIWDAARRKEFDIGYDLAAGERMVRVPIEPKTLKRVASLGATVTFTCYRGEENTTPVSVQTKPIRRSRKPR